MSTSSTTGLDPNSNLPAATPSAEPPARRPLGLVVPTIALIAFWVVTEASFQLEMGMFYRFISRTIVLLVMLLFFLVWGFTRRHFSLGQRWLAFAIIFGTMFVAGAVADATMGVPSMVMMGLPIVISLSVIWLWWARHGSAGRELAGISVIAVAVFGSMTLLRWDGLDGRQRAAVSWRWTPTPEQQFLNVLTSKAALAEDLQQAPLVESPDDWTSFKGGDRQSTVRGIKFANWDQSPPREIWRRRVGPGWSSMIVVGDFLFTQEQRGDREAVVCYQAQTGNEVWVHSAPKPERFEEPLSGTGPRATPTFHENRIYAYGAKGRLECLDATTGQPLWSQSLFELTGAQSSSMGFSNLPTIVDDKVIVFAGGKQDNSLLAFDRLSGKQLWQAAGGTSSYSSPQVMTISGVRQIVMHDDVGLNGIQIEDGKLLWHHASPNAGSFQPMLQPHLIGDDKLLVGWDSGVLSLKIRCEGNAWQGEEQWTSTRLKPSFNDFVIHKDHVFGLDDGILSCMDLAGKRIWKRGRYGFGQLLLLPEIDELLVLGEQGDVIRVATNSNQFQEIGRFQAISGKTWNHPIVSQGRLIVRNGEEMACFQIAQQGQ